MDAIKKKMQAMKIEKDNAMDRADQCEQAAKVAKVKTNNEIQTQKKDKKDKKKKRQCHGPRRPVRAGCKICKGRERTNKQKKHTMFDTISLKSCQGCKEKEEQMSN